MRRPGAWPEAVRDGLRRGRARLGDRGLAMAVLIGLVLAAVVPLAVLPATRCEVFGEGCAPTYREPKAEPARAEGQRQITPVEAATQGAYVALGDSYSAGVGADLTPADLNPLNRCHRTGQAYYHAVSKAFPFKGSAFWACSGATTEDVRDGKSGEAPQLGRIGRDTSLVTISIGGNDVGFSRVLAGCVIKLPWSRSCSEQGRGIAERMATLRQDLPGLLKDIRARSPRARVIVLGYPRAFKESSGTDGDNISLTDQRWLNGQARGLNELIRQAVTEADQRIAATRGPGSVEFVDAYSAFAGHEAGTPDPYMNGLAVNLSALAPESRSYHPTANGYKALAQLFIQQVNRGPGRPLNPPR